MRLGARLRHGFARRWHLCLLGAGLFFLLALGPWPESSLTSIARSFSAMQYDFRNGSKTEKLKASKCFPLCPPDSGHCATQSACPFRATTGRMCRRKLRGYSITSSAVASSFAGTLSTSAGRYLEIDNEFELRRRFDRQACASNASTTPTVLTPGEKSAYRSLVSAICKPPLHLQVPPAE
jgi:hypothetical protein